MQILAQEINKRSRAEWIVTNPLPAGFDVVPQAATGDARGVVRLYLDEVAPAPSSKLCACASVGVGRYSESSEVPTVHGT
jgi:hypothetical protein